MVWLLSGQSLEIARRRIELKTSPVCLHTIERCCFVFIRQLWHCFDLPVSIFIKLTEWTILQRRQTASTFWASRVSAFSDGSVYQLLWRLNAYLNRSISGSSSRTAALVRGVRTRSNARAADAIDPPFRCIYSMILLALSICITLFVLIRLHKKSNIMWE